LETVPFKIDYFQLIIGFKVLYSRESYQFQSIHETIIAVGDKRSDQKSVSKKGKGMGPAAPPHPPRPADHLKKLRRAVYPDNEDRSCH
jgi:hypothetical protein